MAHLEDRWLRKDRTRTERYGKGMRYRVIHGAGSKSFPTKDAAAAYLLQVQAKEHPGVYLTPNRGVLFGEYAKQWEAQQIHQRPSSRDGIERKLRLHILPALGGHRIEQVTRADVQGAVIRWSEVLAPRTVAITYTYLSSIMKAAMLDGLVRANPCVGVRLPRKERELVRPLGVESVQAVHAAMWESYKPLVVFGAATGLRGAEMRGLTWDRVDLVRGLVTVDRQLLSNNATPVWGPPKTQSSVRTIHVGPNTVAMLEGLPRKGVLVFHNKGGAFSRKAASLAWQAMRRRVPDAGAGWHQLRHHHASRLIAGGMSPVAVAHRLGHKDATETLQTYGHLWHDDDERAAVLTDGLGCSLGVPDDSRSTQITPLVPKAGTEGTEIDQKSA